MPIKKILCYPEAETALRKKCEPREAMNRNIKRLTRDIKVTLIHHTKGIGLTSLQINVHQRVLVARPGIDARQLIQEAE